MKQHTYILDTNVYGELLIERDSVELIKRIERDRSLFIYGVNVIEHELNDIPTDKKIKGKIFRELILSTYRSLIDEELVLFPIAEHVASQYCKKYQEAKKSGRYCRVVKTKELKYSIVNKVNGLRTPKLVDYFEFRKRYLK